MATPKSAMPWICLQQQNHGGKQILCNYYAYPRKIQVFTHGLTVKGASKSQGLVVKGGGVQGGESFYVVSEEDSRFVEVFREAQPYIFMHSGSTFVVVLSAEVVASPCLGAILKVGLFLPSPQHYYNN